MSFVSDNLAPLPMNLPLSWLKHRIRHVEARTRLSAILLVDYLSLWGRKSPNLYFSDTISRSSYAGFMSKDDWRKNGKTALPVNQNKFHGVEGDGEEGENGTIKIMQGNLFSLFLSGFGNQLLLIFHQASRFHYHLYLFVPLILDDVLLSTSMTPFR